VWKVPILFPSKRQLNIKSGSRQNIPLSTTSVLHITSPTIQLFIFLFFLCEDDLVAPTIKLIPAIFPIWVAVLLAEGFAINGPLDVGIAARSFGRLKETWLTVAIIVTLVCATASVLGGNSLAHFGGGRGRGSNYWVNWCGCVRWSRAEIAGAVEERKKLSHL
jgi:hypothetical protein